MVLEVGDGAGGGASGLGVWVGCRSERGSARCFVLIRCFEEGESSSGRLFFSHLLPHPQPPLQEEAGDPFGPVRAGSGGGRAPKPPPLHPSRARGGTIPPYFALWVPLKPWAAPAGEGTELAPPAGRRAVAAGSDGWAGGRGPLLKISLF